MLTPLDLTQKAADPGPEFKPVAECRCPYLHLPKVPRVGRGMREREEGREREGEREKEKWGHHYLKQNKRTLSTSLLPQNNSSNP